MTCNAQYVRDRKSVQADRVIVRNIFGDESLKTTDSENDKAWDEIGSRADKDLQWFKEDTDSIIERNYESFMKNALLESYQYCTAVALLYETINGEPIDANVNRKYWQAREGKPVTVETGFRVFKDKKADKY